MLSENIKTFRKAKGFSQEELAIKLNVVRQTVSKWERGLSVPDPEIAVAATMLHGFEWLYVRIAPLAFIGAVAGIVALRPKA